MHRLGGARKQAFFVTLAAFSLQAQTIDPQALLDELRLKVTSTVQHAPRYMCMETIERSWYANRKPVRPGCDTDRTPEAKDRNLVRSDRLRLDVAVGSAQEIFSWHGQKSFETEEIDQLVTAGPISSGSYFSFLSSIFLEGVATVDFRGLRNEADKQLAMFGYTVPIAESKFETRTESGKEVMGYRGEFLVDVSTGQLEQLDVMTDDMPRATWACSFNSEARYGITVLNGAPFQLPTSVVMDVLDWNHGHSKTVTHYRQCHEFLGESVLRFDSAAAVITDPIPSKPVRLLPPGLQLRIKINANLNPKTAWGGDPVEGELAADVLDEHGIVVVPKGAVVNGRLLRLETWLRPSHSYTVALQFRQLSFAGEEYILNLKSITAPPSTKRRQDSIRRKTQLSNPPISDEPEACVFRLTGRQMNLKGVTTYWVTN